MGTSTPGQGQSQPCWDNNTVGASYYAQHFTYTILLNPMRTLQNRNYYNPRFMDEETEIQRGYTAGEQEPRFERL